MDNNAQKTLPRLMNFGQAIEALNRGEKVSRKGWNGKGMYLWKKPVFEITPEICSDPKLKQAVIDNGGKLLGLPTICIYTHDSSGRNAVLTGWQPSQSDIFAADWELVDENKKDDKLKLRLVLRFTNINDYLFVYIDEMVGEFYKLPKCDNVTFSRSCPDSFWILEYVDSEEVHMTFPFNNEYMPRVYVHHCKGSCSPRELEEKIVHMLSNKVFKPENLLDREKKLADAGWINCDNWRTYIWTAEM